MIQWLKFPPKFSNLVAIISAAPKKSPPKEGPKPEEKVEPEPEKPKEKSPEKPKEKSPEKPKEKSPEKPETSAPEFVEVFQDTVSVINFNFIEMKVKTSIQNFVNVSVYENLIKL